MKKRCFTVLLALVLCVGLFPASALAAEDEFVIGGGVLRKYNGPGGDVVVPDGVTRIGEGSNLRGGFCDCTSLTSVVLPDSVTFVSNFQNCTGLTTINIPDSVTEISPYTFQGCTGLTSVVLGKSVTTIGSQAFYGCTSLTEVTIPASVTFIGSDAFHKTALTDVYYGGSKTQWEAIRDVFWSKPSPYLINFHYNSSGPCAVHSYDAGVETTKATCKQEGVMTYTCTDCGKTLEETLPKTGHTPGDAVKYGSDSHRIKCLVCGEVISTEGCEYDDVEVTREATCTATGEMTYTCVFCNETKTEPIDKLDHTPGDIISNGNGTHSTKCAACRQTVSVDACTYSARVVTTPATCTAEGVMTYTCVFCNQTKTEPIDKLDHTPGDIISNGNGTHSTKCAVCRQTVSTDVCTYGDGVVARQPTATEEGVMTYTCTVCNAVRTEPIPALPFIDVPADSWYAGAVNWAVEKGITNGTGDNTFSPEKTCSHVEIVTFLYRAEGSPAASGTAPIEVQSWFADAVNWAYGAGIIDASFDPAAECTRADTVSYMWKAADSPAAESMASFSDVPAGAAYTQAVAWAVDKGVTTGTGDGKFSPGDTCTRGQIVTFLSRAYGK